GANACRSRRNQPALEIGAPIDLSCHPLTFGARVVNNVHFPLEQCSISASLPFVNNVHIGDAAMFKQIVTLVRGRSYEAGQELVDRNALAILRQQIRDSAEAVSAARRAVAIAIAQNEQEATHLKRLIERIGDLEARAVAAIDKGEAGLARE